MSAASLGQNAAAPPSPPTIASLVDGQISGIEKQIVAAAEAMPEGKFDFSPESLNIPGSDYKGVRTFALQVKHVAASNYVLWSALTGDEIPEDFKGGNGPEAYKSKADILKFLRDSFALGHRAAATLTTENMLQTVEHLKSTRLHRATFAVAHAFDHYGQMVEYLRMNGIVPPSTRSEGGRGDPAALARVVDLTTADGVVLKASYFAAGKPGPGVLLIHQGNRDRRAWSDLAARLAAAGIHVLTFDRRGFGDSGGTPHEKWTSKERSEARKAWPGDVDAAWQSLISQPGVARDLIGIGGAGADGVGNSVTAARRHPGEVKSLVLLSGQTDLAGRQFLQSASQLPVLFGVANDDEYPPTQDVMEWTYSICAGPGRKFVHYGGTRPPWLGFEDREGIPVTGGHGTDMFQRHPELLGTLSDWFVMTLIRTPGRAQIDETAAALPSTPILKELETPGGVARVTRKLADARRKDPNAQLWPEIVVSIMGYDHMAAGETKLAVELMKVNVLAYPESADAHDSLSDAYLADGQKELARENAEKALALLPSDTADSETRREEIRDSAQAKLKQLGRS
ncbi:MAG: DinB family protein [Thermoanaerobaculia bacterium]